MRSSQRAGIMSAPLWTPALLTAPPLALWEADDALHITADATTRAVSAWLSQYGGITAAQASTGLQPILSAAVRNGRPGVVFDGMDDCLDLSSVALFPTGMVDSTIAALCYTVSTSINRTPISYGAGTASQDRLLTAGSGGLISGSLNGSVHSAPEAWTANDRLAVWRLSYDAGGPTTTSRLNVNGGATQTATLSTPATGATRGRIGARPVATASGFWAGPIQMAAVFAGALATADRQTFEGWAAWRYGAAKVLPDGHPYKGDAPKAEAWEIERLLDTIRDIPFSCDLMRERVRRSYTPARRLFPVAA